MSELRNVTVIREANVYFGGAVTSRTVLLADGTKKTLGVMQPGDYEFSTGAAELMEILSGDLDVLLPDGGSWQTVRAGEAFRVPGDSRFQLRVHTLTDYCCSFLAE